MTQCANNNPNECIELDDESYTLIQKVFKGDTNKYVRIGPKQYLENIWYKNHGQEFYNFDTHNNDIWIVSLPRSGTTITQEMVWQINNNVETDNKIPLIHRYSFFELGAFYPQKVIDDLILKNIDNAEMVDSIYKIFTPAWKRLNEVAGVRYIKSHLPLSLLPKGLLNSGSKVIYVARNPKDMLVSRFNFCNLYGGDYPESFQLYWKLFEKNLVTLTPYWEHLEEAWQLKDTLNLLFLFYEDIVMKPKDTIIKVAKFLRKELSTEQIDKLADHLKFDNFKNNEAVTKDYYDFMGNNKDTWEFVRKGKVDGWKDELFTSDINEEVDRWIQENYARTTIIFPNIDQV